MASLKNDTYFTYIVLFNSVDNLYLDKPTSQEDF